MEKRGRVYGECIAKFSSKFTKGWGEHSSRGRVHFSRSLVIFHMILR